ncbi:MAG: aminodeoxychorismate/anthranilate synthase component II [Flavobacteriales bacterium]|nr:aminodeoxychorismate/anthranilate synthase component II [Flavobacteriales bacterium]
MSDILLIDNYDSFTYNLYHYLEEMNEGKVVVMRNDEINFEQAESFQKVVISPGPGLPSQAGDLMKFLNQFILEKEILGICLGQQAIAEHFGMRLKNLEEVIHGQAKQIRVLSKKERLFSGLPSVLKVGRYHSWVIDPKNITENIIITSQDDDGNIMSIAHESLPIKAVQFHPESVLTEFGKEMIANWLS